MINKVILVGRLAQSPKVNQTNAKDNMCATFTLAVDRGYKPRDENAQTVDFLYCKAFKKTAANIIDYCRKGSTVCITGQIHNNRYKKEGEEKTSYFTEIVVENIKFLPNFGAIKSSDVLPQTPDEIWAELSDAEKAHTIMVTKEALVKQIINDNTKQRNNTAVTQEDSQAFIQQLEHIVIPQNKEASSPASAEDTTAEKELHNA